MKKINIIAVILVYSQFLGAVTVDPKDLKIYSQNIKEYTKNLKLPKITKEKQKELTKTFINKYFSPWRLKKMAMRKKDAFWGEAYFNSRMYGENYRLIDKKFIRKIKQQLNESKFDTVRQRAITIRNSDLRLFPSSKPMFKDYKDGGEGFPFDYAQNSSIYLNTPLFISHYSKDKAWAFVSANFASGWIKVEDIATVDKKIINKFMHKTNNYYIALKDDFPIYRFGVFKGYVKLGTLFPRYGKKYLIVSKFNDGQGYVTKIDINKNLVKFPLEFNKKNINKIVAQMINKPYGWGGSAGNRDCSLITRDFFLPFGFPMKRNSSRQIYNGKYIKFNNKTNKQKKEYIKKYGIPFLTLVYIKGHIGLYIGVRNGEPLIFHSFWGIRTLYNNKEERYIVGKSVISTLEIGKELKYFDHKKAIINRVEGISILGQR